MRPNIKTPRELTKEPDYEAYSREKNYWIESHPEADWIEIETASKKIAEKYGV